MMRLSNSIVISLSLFLAFGLAACNARFSTSYDAPVAASVAADWQLADVEVSVPEALTVSEAKTILPRADIVWREDPGTDRKAQVATIIADAARAGAAGLAGSRPVRLEIGIQRFHALTFEAESRLKRAGVHDIEFVIQAVDADTGQILAGPTQVQASLPAMAGVEMVEARSRGETQKSQIAEHVRAVIAGWLGLGPDPREKFTRLGA